MISTVNELNIEVEIILNTLKIRFKKLNLFRDLSTIFVSEEFGTAVCCLNKEDYNYVISVIVEKYNEYRVIYAYTFENINDIRERIIWSFMRGGYIRYVRGNFPRQFTNLLIENDFARKIINERLIFWNKRPKYKFFIEENELALSLPVSVVLSRDSSFYDYMPE